MSSKQAQIKSFLESEYKRYDITQEANIALSIKSKGSEVKILDENDDVEFLDGIGQ